jgi:hypothetical protein
MHDVKVKDRYYGTTTRESSISCLQAYGVSLPSRSFLIHNPCPFAQQIQSPICGGGCLKIHIYVPIHLDIVRHHRVVRYRSMIVLLIVLIMGLLLVLVTV